MPSQRYMVAQSLIFKEAAVKVLRSRSGRTQSSRAMLLPVMLMLVSVVLVAVLAVACGAGETGTATTKSATVTTIAGTDTSAASGPAGAWSELTSADAQPAPRSGATMVYDANGDSLILFGGWDVDTDFNDTWLYDPAEGAWTDLALAGSIPAPRALYQMAFDMAQGVAVLFGGTSDAGRYGDTWVFDPMTAAWSEVAAGEVAPEPRSAGAMVYDEEAQLIVMFGGVGDAGRFDDTWIFDTVAATWAMVGPSEPVPSARSGHAMAYDGFSGQIVLFGGYDGSNLLDDTWVFDLATNTWTEVSPAGEAPIARGNHCMAYDPYSGFIYLFGGSDGAEMLNDLWAYDLVANVWTEVTLIGTLPVGREQHTLVYDQGRGRLLLFGGFDASETELADLWEYVAQP